MGKRKMIIRIIYKKEGGHYHCRIFTQLPRQATSGTFAQVGEMIIDEEDFHHLQNHHNRIEVHEAGAEKVEFLVSTDRRNPEES